MPLAAGWAVWAKAHLEFGGSVNLIPTRVADFAHCITACPSEFENLMASLDIFMNFFKSRGGI